MTISRSHIFVSLETLTAALLNAEFNNILTNLTAEIQAVVAAYAAAGSLDLNGAALILDADGDLKLIADSDDKAILRLSSTDLVTFDLSTASAVNGLTVTPSAASNPVNVAATGSDTDIHIILTPKGAGTVRVSSLTASRALVSDANKGLTSSATTATELGYVNGVTSAIQTQIDGKAATSHSHAISDVTSLQTSLDAKAATADILGLQTIWVPADAIRPMTTNGCAGPTQVELTANQPELVVLDFDGTTIEYCQFKVRMPKSYDGSDLYFQLYWTSSATDTDGVVFQLRALSIGDGEAINQAFGAGSTSVTDNAQSTANDLYVSSVSTGYSIPSWAAGELVYFQLRRLTNNASDTMAEDARVEGLCIFYNTSALNDD